MDKWRCEWTDPMILDKEKTGIPIIDAENILAPNSLDKQPSDALCESISQACREWGFFVLQNHGFDEELLNRLTEVMHRFFDLPVSVKETVRRSETNAMGWANDELTKQRKDLKEVFDWCYIPHPELPSSDPRNHTIDGFNLWPDREVDFREVLQSYFVEMTKCAFRLLRIFCKGLGISEHALDEIFDGGIGFARLNFYERLESQDIDDSRKDSDLPALGIHNHTDAGFLTILYQDAVEGLQMLHNDTWIDIPAVSGSFIINVGDMCTVLSNGEFRAPIHRVLAPKGNRRYSVPFFFNPSPTANIEPLPCFLTEGRLPKYRSINWGEFRSKRFAGDYRDKGKEIQISDYLKDTA